MTDAQLVAFQNDCNERAREEVHTLKRRLDLSERKVIELEAENKECKAKLGMIKVALGL